MPHVEPFLLTISTFSYIYISPSPPRTDSDIWLTQKCIEKSKGGGQCANGFLNASHIVFPLPFSFLYAILTCNVSNIPISKCLTSQWMYIQSFAQPPPTIQQGLLTNGIHSCYCRLCYWLEDSFVYLQFSENRTGAEKWSRRIVNHACVMLQPMFVYSSWGERCQITRGGTYCMLLLKTVLQKKKKKKENRQKGRKNKFWSNKSLMGVSIIGHKTWKVHWALLL